MNSIGWRCTRLVLIDSTVERGGERGLLSRNNLNFDFVILFVWNQGRIFFKCLASENLREERILGFLEIFFKKSGLFYSIFFEWFTESIVAWIKIRDIFFYKLLLLLSLDYTIEYMITSAFHETKLSHFHAKRIFRKKPCPLLSFLKFLRVSYFNVCIQHTFPRENSFDKVGRCTRVKSKPRSENEMQTLRFLYFSNL